MLNIPRVCASNVEQGPLRYNDHHLNQSLDFRLSQQRYGSDSVRECENM